MASGYYYYPKNIKTCDVCGKPRGYWRDSYKHEKCSKLRQARSQAPKTISKKRQQTLTKGEDYGTPRNL